MIDTSVEQLIPFADAGQAFPGKPVCKQTLHRWRNNGVRGVKLETLLIGGLRYTSAEAIQRFIQAQNPTEQAPVTTTPSERQRRSAAAREALRRMGI